LLPTGVGVEKGLVVDLAGGLHCRTVGGVRVSRLSGDRRRPCCWRAQESDQPFDVLGAGGKEELLLNEPQPAQAASAYDFALSVRWKSRHSFVNSIRVRLWLGFGPVGTVWVGVAAAGAAESRPPRVSMSPNNPINIALRQVFEVQDGICRPNDEEFCISSRTQWA
jgi:hypothetical protein